MTEILFGGLSLFWGITMGFIFFGGLWFTVKKALNSKKPAFWFLGSFVLRMALVTLGFYGLVHNGNLANGLIGLLGFIAARFIIVKWTNVPENKSTATSQYLKASQNEA